MSKVIEVECLVKQFGSFVAVNNLTFSVSKGEIFGLLGANGAGKTTTIRMLCGLLAPSSGKILVSGYDAFTQPEQIRASIGYMSQKFSLYSDLTVWENIRFFGGIYGLWGAELKKRAEELVDEFSMHEFQNVKVESLPMGWRQRISLAVSLVHRPPVIFLDEPTSGVDPIARRMFWETIHQISSGGTTVLVTTHYMDEAEYCHTALIMVDGKIVAMDKPKVLKEQMKAQSMNEVFITLARNGNS
ncbi:ABC transporter ATP-binding protein [Tenuifilum thalassicum]|uniref:ABC transporter ATP-binding protein n=1 Tax=Tenuifilum thalassicum TaxID=2590900 RepID=A0A7D4BED1_9BACT|nr:ABC transporter ATP-binding protein [Tenuifilum thalassicum]QKG79918.1 ABC transporter ATP-binding protein [Tenuifilum thalassicum]